MAGHEEQANEETNDGLGRAIGTVTILSLLVAVVASLWITEGQVENWESLSGGTQVKAHLLIAVGFFIVAPVGISILFFVLPIRALGFKDRDRPAAFFASAVVGVFVGVFAIGSVQDRIGVNWVGDEQEIAAKKAAADAQPDSAPTDDGRTEVGDPPSTTEAQAYSDDEKADMLFGYHSTTKYGPLLVEMGFFHPGHPTLFMNRICKQFDRGATAEDVRRQFIEGFADELHKAEAIVAFYAAGVPLYCAEHLATIQAT